LLRISQRWNGNQVKEARRHMKIRIPAILFLLAPAACAPDRDAEPRPATVTRDSAGVHIIQNARPPEGSRLPWRIGPDPTVSIGAREGEAPYMFNGAVSATKLPGGRIVVADGSSSELRMFDSVGTHLRTWGGEGGRTGRVLVAEPRGRVAGRLHRRVVPRPGAGFGVRPGRELRALLRSVGRLSSGVSKRSGGAPGRHHPDHVSG